VESIKRLFLLGSLLCTTFIFLSFFAGCAGSENAGDEDTHNQNGSSSKTILKGNASRKKQSPGFNVQADTLTVHPRKKGRKENSSVGVRSSVSKYYSVQIGAYKSARNAEKSYELSLKRFKQPVIRFYEPGIKMERLCVGRFPTAKAAKEFAKSIQEQYPADYKEAWVTILHHE